MKISATAGVRGRPLASTRMSIDFFSRAVVDVAEADLGDLRMVHLVLERGDEALALDRHLDQRLALGDRGDRRVEVLERIDAGPC